MTGCFVKGCRSSRYVRKKEENREKRHFFKPITIEMLNLWRMAIPEGDNFQMKNVICDLHFEEGDVLTEYVSKMPDGSEFHLERGRPMLAEGAIPKIFPEIKKTPIVTIDEEFEKESDFSLIHSRVDDIPLPSLYWYSKTVPNHIFWNSWSEDVTIIPKRMSVNVAKKVTVHFGEKQIKFQGFEKVENVSDIMRILNEVENLFPCSATSLGRARNCIGYILKKDKSAKGRQIKVCAMCHKHRINIYKEAKKGNLVQKLKERNLKLREKCRTINQRQKRLLKKQELLQAKMRNLQQKYTEVVESKISKTVSQLLEKEYMDSLKTKMNKTVVHLPEGEISCKNLQ